MPCISKYLVIVGEKYFVSKLLQLCRRNSLFFVNVNKKIFHCFDVRLLWTFFLYEPVIVDELGIFLCYKVSKFLKKMRMIRRLKNVIEKVHSNSSPGCCYKLFANFSIYKNKDIHKIILQIKRQKIKLL